MMNLGSCHAQPTLHPQASHDEPFQSKQPNHDQLLQSKNNHTITACIIRSQRLRPRTPTLRITRKTPLPIHTSRKEINSEIVKKILGHREAYNGIGAWRLQQNLTSPLNQPPLQRHSPIYTTHSPTHLSQPTCNPPRAMIRSLPTNNHDPLGHSNQSP